MAIPVRFRRMMCDWIGLLLFAALPVQAQFKVLTTPDLRVGVGDAIVLFVEWEGPESVEGLSLRVPSGWTLLEANVSGERGQFETAESRHSDQDASSWFVGREADQALLPGQRIRLKMRAEATASTSIFIGPVSDRTSFESGTRGSEEIDIDVLTRPSRSMNRALLLDGSESARQIRTARAANLTTQSDWTLAFRVRSTGLGQTVLSSWTGYEDDPYPVEAVFDESGHLTVYTGRDQRHFAMRSATPLADGSWHHVVVVHDQDTNKMKLHIDAAATDSLQFENGISMADMMPSIRLGDRLENSRRDLSAPFEGEIDDVSLFARPLGLSTIDEWTRSGRWTAITPLWDVDFDTPESVIAIGLVPDDLSLEPSLLSFRRAASDVRAERATDGVTLSFLPGDDGVLWYEIEMSTDGEVFRPATRLEIVEGELGRVEWLDRTPGESVRHYRVTTHYEDGPSDVSRVIKVGLGTDGLASRVLLEGNFPNPFNPTTTIRFEVLEREHVRVSIWDLAGQMIAQPVDGEHGPGRYEVGFDAGSLPSGTYFVRLESPSGIQTHQMILMK